MREWIGGLASSLAKGVVGLWVSANVALWERKLATRLSSGFSSAINRLMIDLCLLLDETENWRDQSEMTHLGDSMTSEGGTVYHSDRNPSALL